MTYQPDSRFTLIRFWFEIESTNDWQMSESRFTYLSFSIPRWIMIPGWIVIRDESMSNRIKMNKIKLIRKSKWMKNSNDLWIKVNRNESESKIKWFAQVNQKSKKDFDTLRESKSFFDFCFNTGESKIVDQN